MLNGTTPEIQHKKWGPQSEENHTGFVHFGIWYGFGIYGCPYGKCIYQNFALTNFMWLIYLCKYLYWGKLEKLPTILFKHLTCFLNILAQKSHLARNIWCNKQKIQCCLKVRSSQNEFMKSSIPQNSNQKFEGFLPWNLKSGQINKIKALSYDMGPSI